MGTQDDDMAPLDGRTQAMSIACNSELVHISRTHRIGANPDKSDFVNFQGPEWRIFSDLCFLRFSQESQQNAPKTPA